MLRQTFAAIWSWLIAKQPTYKLPVVEITQRDPRRHDPQRPDPDLQPAGHAHPAHLNMGSGFFCDVINLSGANVTFGAGIITSSGSTHCPPDRPPHCVATYSGGTIVFASSQAQQRRRRHPPAPGQVTGLSASSPTPSSIR